MAYRMVRIIYYICIQNSFKNGWITMLYSVRQQPFSAWPYLTLHTLHICILLLKLNRNSWYLPTQTQPYFIFVSFENIKVNFIQNFITFGVLVILLLTIKLSRSPSKLSIFHSIVNGRWHDEKWCFNGIRNNLRI